MQAGIKSLLILIILGITFGDSYSQLKTPLIIQSGMVIQRDQEIPLWGEGQSNKLVKADLNGISDSITVFSDDTWRLSLPAMEAGGPHTLTIQSEEEELIYTDIYIGDVWIASGQSNMKMTLEESDLPDSEIDTTDNHQIRQFMVNRSLKNTAAEEVPSGSKWTPATMENVGDFSAVGFYFSHYLYDHLDIPIGIINTSFGGARIEAWMSNGMLGYDEQDIILGDGTSWLQPTVAYNAMLHPLRNVPVKGFLWYQGESNAGSREDAILYRKLFKKMISSWRELWGLGDLPFLWVQLPNFNTEGNENTPGTWDAWPLIRESLSSAHTLPNTGEAITIDVGEPDIHPKNKQPVGKRLALVARNLVYQDTIEYSGPRYKSHQKLANGRVEISFNHVGDGLTIADTTYFDGLKWFSIVKSNGSIVRAEAKIEGDKVIVWNNTVSDPYAIRYAWETNPAGVNFYNKAGLPAAPFYIYVDEPELNIKTFLSQTSHIDRGESTILRWETLGTDSVLLNNMLVETKSALRVWPIKDSVFTLEAIDTTDENNVISKPITITVRQPIPQIEISSSCGDILPLDSTVLISSEVSAEGGAPIEKVEFLLNEELYFTDFESPYQCEMTPENPGEFTINGIIYNELQVSTESNEISLSVRELEFIKYEAEDANYKPGGRILSCELCSQGFYLDLMNDWTLTFDSVIVDTSENHLLYINYMLNYGSPKVQNLLVNDSLISILIFTAPDQSSWQDLITTVPLDSGRNKIVIEGFWDYMSFDYLSVGTKPSLEVIDTTTIDTTTIDTTSIQLFNANILGFDTYPNPSNGNVTVEFNIPGTDHVTIKAYDMKGAEETTILDRELLSGIHHIPINFRSDERGIYILQLRYKNLVLFRKLVLL